MSAVQAIVEAARAELGDSVVKEHVRVSCPKCGVHLVSVMVVPNLVRDRCDKCRVDVVVLIARDRSVLSATET